MTHSLSLAVSRMMTHPLSLATSRKMTHLLSLAVSRMVSSMLSVVRSQGWERHLDPLSLLSALFSSNPANTRNLRMLDKRLRM